MNTICPHLFSIKSLLKSLPAHFDIINQTLDRLRNRDFSVVANYHGYTKRGHLSENVSYSTLCQVGKFHSNGAFILMAEKLPSPA